ncbi:YchJ family metal-binding protein [Streptomyces sp. NPDC049585]|uniref:YchJ family protein n=1 Tax=Streptomyces sp. NPDC049585 TaxID=3155154 RepID=UPI003437590C
MSRRKARNRPQPPVLATSPCPCGRQQTYAQCCGAFHSGSAAAPTAERLMRSRYSAFVALDGAYLLRTWHSTTRPRTLDFDPDIRWTGLEILSTTGGSAFHQDGTVEFRAHYELHGEAGSQHELSRFVRQDGAWVYVDAVE